MATSTRIKFSEFIDLLLARLYDLDREGETAGYFDLNAIKNELKVDIPQRWVWDAGRVLQSRGLADCLFAMGGKAEAVIAGEGRLYVEEEQGTGIIKEYHQQPQNYVIVSGTANQVVVSGEQSSVTQTMTIEQERKPAFDLLKQIEEKLKQDQTLDPGERNDLLADVEMIRGQLRKRDPNRTALAAILEPLSQVSSIGGLIVQLIRLFNP